MKKILDIITSQVTEAFAACGYEEGFAKVTLSNRPDLCEYQCNGAMAAAKAYQKKPIAIAKEVVDRLLQKSDVFSHADAVMPGFINLKLQESFLASYMNGMFGEARCGCEKAYPKKRVIVDYGGANVAKPLHVGHLRPAIIGESIKRMGRFLGHQVIGDVHLGDWGLQMGLIIEELRERKPELSYFDEGFHGRYPGEAPFTIAELEEIYPAASKRAKLDEAFSERAHEATLKLQNGYAPYRAIWSHIMNVSVADLKKNYESLNVTFDLWKGESDAQPYIPELIKDLVDRGIAHESQGALVVDIAMPGDSKELPPCIIQKSDGAALYSTSDLGTIIEREREYQPDWYIYITDKRQELHFVQVFRVARMAGIVPEDRKLSHLSFGTMNGTDGKPFKTRDGGVMRLETMISDIEGAAYRKMTENRSISEEEAIKTSRIVGLAALKYGDLSNQASKDYVFDMERFVSFEGNTGPYILYTIVRIKSILAKARERGKVVSEANEAVSEANEAVSEANEAVSEANEAVPKLNLIPSDAAAPYGDAAAPYSDAAILPAISGTEKDLMLQLSRFSEAIESSFMELAPHKLCQYVYELANAFNRFYHDTKIIAEGDKEQRASWLKLITLVKEVLTTCIDLLGIQAPERM